MDNHPKAFKILLTWRYLIYPGVSRGMRKNIVVVDPPRLVLKAPWQAAAVSLRQPTLRLSPVSDLPQQQLCAVSLVSVPPAEVQNAHLCCRDLPCGVDQLLQVVFKAFGSVA